MFLRELHVICFQSLWFGNISKGGYNPRLISENIVICSQIDKWPKPRPSEPMIIYSWTFAKIKAEYTELWQCQLRTVEAIFSLYWDLAGDRANIDKGWEMKKEKMSHDEIFKPLGPAMPEMFCFVLLNCMSLYIPLLSSSSFTLLSETYYRKRINFLCLWKAGNTKLVNGKY